MMAAAQDVCQDGALDAAFVQALAAARLRAPTVNLPLRLAGLSTMLSITGAALAESLARPFRHLAIDRGPQMPGPVLRIEAWSAVETGVAAPAFADDLPPHSADGSRSYRRQPGSRALANCLAGRVLAGFEDAHALAYSDLAKPFRSLLIPILRGRGCQLLHAGMVVPRAGGPGLLLAGRSGSGKSTVAISALAAGFGFLGDDHVCARLEDGGLTGHSLFATCGVAADHLRRFPRLPGQVVDAPDRAKKVILLGEREMPRVLRSAPISAIVLPRVAPGGPTRHRPASRGEALRALMPGSITPRLPRPPAEPHWQFDGIGRLAATLPAFHLDLGADLDAIPAALDDLAGRLAAAAKA